MPPLIHKFFWYQKICGKQKGSCTKLFVWVMWDKKFRQNRDAPLLCMKISDKGIFLKHQSVLQWNISVQWDKKFSTENLDTPPPPLIQTFSIPEIIATVKDSPYGNFRHCETKKRFDGKSWYPLPPLWCIKFFTTRSFLIHRNVPQWNFSVLWGKKLWKVHRISKSVVELMFVENFRKLDFKQ